MKFIQNRMVLPSPPKLKTSITQLNKDADPEDKNYEVLCNDYVSDRTNKNSSSASISCEEQHKRKRRKSSYVDGVEELAKRRTETKQLHSIIEKRRRLKLNREFEALKYLNPACRAADSTTSKISTMNNANKIDGMYKLTILKTSVEYILYLHHIIQKQHCLISSLNSEYSFDDSFAKVPLDVNQYRNIDRDFDFHELTSRIKFNLERPDPEMTLASDFTQSIAEIKERPEWGNLKRTQISKAISSGSIQKQLPTPHMTPQILPAGSILKPDISFTEARHPVSTYASDIQPKSGLFKELDSQALGGGPQTQSYMFVSSKRSASLTSDSASKTHALVPAKLLAKKNEFKLPEPALVAVDAKFDYGDVLPVGDVRISLKHASPRSVYFESKIPHQSSITNVDLSNRFEVNCLENNRHENFSKTQLTSHKPSIDRLLN